MHAKSENQARLILCRKFLIAISHCVTNGNSKIVHTIVDFEQKHPSAVHIKDLACRWELYVMPYQMYLLGQSTNLRST